MSLVFRNALMRSENLQLTQLRLAHFMRRFLFVALTAGLFSPTAAIADTYDALCNNNDCQITISETGLAGPQGFIAKEKITQWYTGGDEYNLALGAAGGAAGGAGATTGVSCGCGGGSKPCVVQ